MPLKYAPQDEKALMSELWDPAIAENLEAFVLFAYPWGQPNTPLHDQKGPRNWQRDELQELTEHIQVQRLNQRYGLPLQMFKKATASGRGPGKSALVSWLCDWNLTCNVGSTTIVTANTEPQLKTKTFAEIGKWTNLLINKHWFETSVLAVRPAEWFKLALADQLKIDSTYYYCQGLLWSEENPDAFAGAHNMYGLMLLFDEASGIPVPIFNVSEGFFTDLVLHRYWQIFSNPRRNIGGFFDAFHKDANYWRLRQLDSRTVEGIDHARLEAIIEKNGIDSDVARVEVLGQFPVQGEKQFIGNTAVYGAQKRVCETDAYEPLIMGVDVARYGNDHSVIRFRRGRDARSIEPFRQRGLDNMALAHKVAEFHDVYKPDAVCIDAGQGTGVIDRLREMGYKNIFEIWFGAKSQEPEYANMRTWLYACVRDWLPGGMIDESPILFTDLTAQEYYFFGKAKDQINLCSKEEFAELIGRSPDDGDALALTFGKKMARRDRPNMSGGRFTRNTNHPKQCPGIDAPVFSE